MSAFGPGGRSRDTSRDDSVTAPGASDAMLPVLMTLDEETATLVRLAAALAGGSEAAVRASLTSAARLVRPVWVEELILQTYLFAGFPRALNGAREWRRISGQPAPEDGVAIRRIRQ